MGNEQTGQTNAMKDYLPLTSSQIGSLGTLTLYRNSVTNDMKINLQTSYSIPNKSLAESEVQQMMKLNNNPYACKLVKFSVFKNKMLCLETYSLDLIFEAFPNSLSSLIANKKSFSIDEIWAVAEHLLSYLFELKMIGLSDGDLQPKNIFFNSGSATKVLNFLLFTTYQNSYKLRITDRSYTSNLAPELLLQMRNGIVSPDYDPYKADVFSYGIVLLSMASGTPFETFYNFVDNTVLFDNIKRKLVFVADSRKSPELFEFIDSCLKQNVSERANLEQLAKMIPGKNMVGSSIPGWRH